METQEETLPNWLEKTKILLIGNASVLMISTSQFQVLVKLLLGYIQILDLQSITR